MQQYIYSADRHIPIDQETLLQSWEAKDQIKMERKFIP